MLSRQTLLDSALFNLQLFTGMLERENFIEFACTPFNSEKWK